MAIDTERIFLLATKKSQRVEKQTMTVNIGKVMKFHIFIMRNMPIRCRRL